MRTALAVLALMLTAIVAAAQTMSVDPVDPIVIEAPLNADPPTTFVINVTADRTTNWIVTGLPKWLKASSTFGRTPAAVTFTVTPPSSTVGASYGATLSFTNLRTRLGDTTRAVAVEVVAEEPKPSNATWRLDGEVTPAQFMDVGALLQFRYTATNTGDARIAGVMLWPSLPSDCPSGDLAPGETLNCAFDHAVTQDDIAAGRVLNTTELQTLAGSPSPLQMSVVATYIPPLQAGNEYWRVETITPALTFITIDDQLGFSFKLTNLMSSQPILNYGMVAGPMGWLCYQEPVLAPGASAICSGSYVVAQADIDAGVFQFELYVVSSIGDLRLNAVAAYTPPYVLLCGDGPCLDDKGGRLVTP